MLGAGIHPNDILVVDRSLEPVSGKVVICAINGELTVKRLERVNDQWQLKAENSDYADIVIHDELELVIWGCRNQRYSSPVRQPHIMAEEGSYHQILNLLSIAKLTAGIYLHRQVMMRNSKIYLHTDF